MVEEEQLRFKIKNKWGLTPNKKINVDKVLCDSQSVNWYINKLMSQNENVSAEQGGIIT